MQLFFKNTVLMPLNSTVQKQLKMHVRDKDEVLYTALELYKTQTLCNYLLKRVRHALQEYFYCNGTQAHKTSTSDTVLFCW